MRSLLDCCILCLIRLEPNRYLQHAGYQVFKSAYGRMDRSWQGKQQHSQDDLRADSHRALAETNGRFATLMGSSPLGSRTATLWAPHNTFLMGEAQACAASEVGANTITLVGAASSPCLCSPHETLVMAELTTFSCRQ